VDERRRVELTFADTDADAAPVTVQPLGLILKAGSWYLVSAAQETIEVVCIDGLRATRLTNRRFPPPPGFELAQFWKSHAASPRRVKTR
jgi:predicted DNA-binding transcriptional regulator YafY